ncbi:MAG: hypothetical protein ABIR47_13290, partial [Candidatus Kapaibacterium sp.]
MKRGQRRSFSDMVALAAIAMVMLLCGSLTASAQRWQTANGGKQWEAGRGGAHPTAAGGYITCGESN